MIVADFLVLLFFGHSFSRIIFRFGVPGLAFLAVYCLILGRNAKCFAMGYLQNQDEEQYVVRLKKIGAIPIKMIALNALLHPIFLGIVFQGEYLGVKASIKGPLFLASMSFGMLIGTFIYVVSDGLVSRTLLAQHLTGYPRNLRERRQEIKACIVPLAAVLVSLLFAIAITMLGINKSGTQGSLSNISIPIVIFFFCIVALALNLKKNASVLYTSIVEQLENISSEHKDLTRRISICSVDELGTIAGMVNVFCEQLGDGIRDIKGGQKELSGTGSRLEENASDMVNSITRILSAVEQVLVKSQDQKDSAGNSSRAIQEIANQIKALEESIYTQTTSITQASTSIEQMVGNISSINTMTEKMTDQFKSVGTAADEGIDIQKKSEERILAIVQQSQALQEANKIIATIAARTNLLAMNAAIEAAHAGETGRGFSVVADEIRKLAENSSSESKKIGSELKQIIQTIDHIVRDSASSSNAFTDVSNRVDETEKLVFEVNNAIHEQKTGASQVMEALRVMNDVTAQVKDGSREISQGKETMIREINILQTSAGAVLTNIEEMSGNIKSINTGAQEVSNLAVSTRSSIQKISSIADEFEV
jgi:methyl-accepting chemotaxis protein